MTARRSSVIGHLGSICMAFALFFGTPVSMTERQNDKPSPGRPRPKSQPSVLMLWTARAPRTVPSAKQKTSKIYAESTLKADCPHRWRRPAPGEALSFCHGPPGRGIHRHFHDFWHAGPHDSMTAFCHRPLGAKLAANSLVFRAPAHHDSATTFCHRPPGSNLCYFLLFLLTHDRMTE